MSFRTSVSALRALALILVIGITASANLSGQGGVLGRVRRAAEEAAKAAADARREAEAKKAKDEAAKVDGERGGAAAATPGRTPQTTPQNSAATTVSANASFAGKVDAQTVITLEPGAAVDYDVSPTGQNVAAVVPRGSRQTLVYNGVASQPFDEIFPDSITFSLDASRYSYVARIGQEYVYMVDGKEFARFPVATTDRFGGTFTSGALGNQTSGLGFTTNSRHTYFLVRTKPPSGGNDTVAFYFDGKPGPTFATDPSPSPVFSPDGDRYAYVGYDPTRSNRPPVLVVDGKPAPWQGGDPRFTGDSKHIVTGTLVSGGATELQLDGKPWFRVPSSIQLHFAPVTDLVVGFAAVPNSLEWHLYVNGKRLQGAESYNGYRGVRFSEDGKHWAVVAQTAANSQFVIVDGKKGLEYQSVDNLVFLRDGRVAYRAGMPQRQFVVIGDEESNGYQQIAGNVFDPTVMLRLQRAGEGHPLPVMDLLTANGHVLFAGRTAQNTTILVMDNKPVGTPLPRGMMSLTLSPDGTRTAYVDGRPGNQPVIDGVPQTGATFALNAKASFVFSPDSKHVAYLGYTRGGNGFDRPGVVVDGKYVPFADGLQARLSRLSFSPDGRHVFWVAATQRAGGGRSVVYVDGIRAVELDDQINFTLDPIEEKWSVGNDGVLTFVAQDGNAVKRFRVTPPLDTSVDTLLKLPAIQ